MARKKVLRQKWKGISGKQLLAHTAIISSSMIQLHINMILKLRLIAIIITTMTVILIQC